jgi:hypothetical protein
MNYHKYYPYFSENLILNLLYEPEIAESLVKVVNNKMHSNLRVEAKPHSIEISNEEISVSVIFFSGFELNEWLTIKEHSNPILISFWSVIPDMCEFEGLNVKYIDRNKWLLNIKNYPESKLNGMAKEFRKLDQPENYSRFVNLNLLKSNTEIKTKISGHRVQIILDDLVFKNSSIYKILVSANSIENIKAEIERIENDIDLALDLAKLNPNLADVFQIIRGSNDSKSAEIELTEQYHMKAEHVQEFLELELSELSGVNFSIIAEALQKQKTLHQSILNDHLGDK